MQLRVEVRVNETNYTIQHFMPTKGIPILVRLANLSGLSLNGAGKGMDEDAISALMTGIGEMLSKMDDKKVMALVQDLMSCVYVGTSVQPCNIDSDFIGKMGDLFEVLTHVVRVQYTDFFSRAGGLFAKAVKTALEKVEMMKPGLVSSLGSAGDQS